MNLLKERLCSGGNFDREQFMTPPAALGPFYTWIWNVEITREEIDAQLDEMAEGGIRATYILPEPKEFRPQTMVTDMEPAYLTPEFMELARYAMEQAQKRGIALWLYDEGGWPSGGACGQVVRQMPEAEKKMISRREIPGAEAAKLPEDSYVRVTTTGGKTLSRAEMAGEDTVWLYEVVILHGPVPQADSADEEERRNSDTAAAGEKSLSAHCHGRRRTVYTRCVCAAGSEGAPLARRYGSGPGGSDLSGSDGAGSMCGKFSV